MADVIEVRVPDLGDFDAVDVIEVLVAPGDRVAEDDPLITLESDKASMDVPSPRAGTVAEVTVAAGDSIGQGDVILTLEPAAQEAGAKADASTEDAPDGETPDGDAPATGASGYGRPPAGGSASGGEVSSPAPVTDEPEADQHAGLLVLGSGPGGYSAAFRAADLGLDVVLVERHDTLGGVCLNVGCIPSKALLHAGEVIEDAAAMAEHGIRFGEPEIDLDALRAWKDSVVGQLTGGLAGLAKRRGVRVVQGEGRFVSPHRLAVETPGGETTVIGFEQAIVAAGSRVIEIGGVPWDDPRVMDSTDALELADVPERLLIVGGGIIGLEMGCVYSALGSKVTVVELLDRLMAGADRDVVKPFHDHVAKRWEAIHLETKVAGIEATDEGLVARLEGADGGERPTPEPFDRVLVAVGRRPNGDRIGAEAAGLAVDERGFLPVDNRQRTNVEHIFAIGDIVGGPMLAHKASHEGKVAAEVAAGEASANDARAIPSVAYTDPEVAWVGLTEEEAKEQGRPVGKGVFPWSASGRALGLGRPEGKTKLLFDPDSGRLLGAGMVGPGAGDLVAEAALALEMGADAQDLGLTIHPHPTLSETVAFAAEMFEGTIVDLYAPKKKTKTKKTTRGG